MDLQLHDTTALVTGSSAGIGFATAVGLAREGAHVVLNGRDAGRLDAARQRLLDAVPGASIDAVAANVGTADGAEALIAAVPATDILVNNAATFGPQAFADIPDAEWQRHFDSNVMSGVRLSRHYLAGMLERDRGRILFIGSDAAVQPQVDQLHYSVTKAAGLALARGLAELTRGTRVTVNTVLPGPTATEGVTGVLDGLSEQTGLSHDQLVTQLFETNVTSSLLRRLATPDEVANLLVYLASPLAGLTNGAAVRAEGGILRSMI
ncbi:SDR family oxidoreductase [Solirubrobacter phytolaccae]|uniref:SDR family oxidoreductase n=1 Tax=Solirubrobacter phytolaccae TaxID=1404360 RepID=A0A9X3S9D2_9ACTN|nr:SDR family oxidoreductase [Solirubrobacter phytolaccae]MDA0182523.1 SDR family oxidoreductase [Solirubrobacter phytolaccae]